MPAPPKVNRQQLEMLIDCMAQNREMMSGRGGSPHSQLATKQKWVQLSKKLNVVPGGFMKTPERWKNYWCEWRYRCRKKNYDSRKFIAGIEGGQKRYSALNELEEKTVALDKVGSEKPSISRFVKVEVDDFHGEEPGRVRTRSSGSENMLEIIADPPPAKQKKTMKLGKRSPISTSKGNDNVEDTRADTPPPKWATQIEERKIAAEERMADALATIAEVMQRQEQRVAGAMTTIAGSVQDLSNGVQDVLQHLHQLQSSQFEDKHFPITKIFCDETQ